MTNEELLRIIISNAKRNLIVTTAILCDDSGYGRQGHNIHSLLRRFSHVTGHKTTEQETLISQHRTEIKQIKLLRNNFAAHVAVSEEWRRPFGRLTISALDNLISTLYQIVFRCNKAVGLRRVSEQSLRKATSVYAERLMRAFQKQAENGEVGIGYASVDECESGDAYL